MDTNFQVWSWRKKILEFAPDNAYYKHILLTLSCYMNEAGGSCFPSIDTLVRVTSLSKPTVLKYLKKAKNDGWIKIKNHGFGGMKWKRNDYTASVPRVVKELNHDGKGWLNSHERVVKELNPNTTSNTTSTLLSDLSSDDFDRQADVDEQIDWTTVRLHEKLRPRFSHHQSMKKATLEKWRVPIRRMIEQDELSIQQVWELIDFALNDEFWADTIKSTGGLRKNWEQIDAARMRRDNKNSNQTETAMAYNHKSLN